MKAATVSGANQLLMAHATTSRDPKERAAATKRLAELGLTAQEAGIPAATAPN